MATTTASSYFPLATEDPYTGGSDAAPGSASAGSDGTPDSAAGASGYSSGGFELSHGGLIAIIIIVVVVGIIGIGTAILFYVAKKREWKVRETLRKSARKVVTALTPRRSEFPRSIKEGSSAARSRGVRINDVPPTPRLTPEDLEKGHASKMDVKRKYFGRK